jgi:hypothetical protein
MIFTGTYRKHKNTELMVTHNTANGEKGIFYLGKGLMGTLMQFPYRELPLIITKFEIELQMNLEYLFHWRPVKNH